MHKYYRAVLALGFCFGVVAALAQGLSLDLGLDSVRSQNWVLSGASLDFDFTSGRFYQAGQAAGDSSLVTVSRASTKYCDDTLGNWTQANNNVLCLTDKGALIEEARTNGIRNNSMQGAVAGSPGTLPANWGTNIAGLTRTIVGTGTQNGIDYIEIRFNGTTAGTFGLIFFGVQNTEVAATYGQTWTHSFWLWLTAGDFTNVTTISSEQRPNAGGSIDTAITAPTSALTRYSVTKTHTSTTETSFVPAILLNWSNGVAIDFTIRIGWPQAENNNINSTVASATQATGGATCTNGAQLFTVSGGTGTAATLTGTVVTNALQAGSLTVTTPGSYTVFPPSPATVTGGGCGTPPTVNLVPTDNSALGFATSPIRTTSAAATRAADVATVTNSPTFGSAYSLFPKGTPNAPTGYTNDQNILQIDNGSDAQRTLIRRNKTTGLLLTTQVGSSGGENSPVFTWSQGSSGKVAFAIQANDQGASVNGSAATTSAVVTLPTTPTAVDIGSAFGGGNSWNGYVERLALWPSTRLPNATLQSLTQ